MGREAKKVSNGEPDPEADERKRLTKLAISNNLVSETPAKGFVPLEPSKIVAKHHGKDILKKSQRKNRYLFSFPGLLGPIGGGKIGELTNLGSKNPILYLEFPQGRMKLFGTIVYPKNRYLTIQYSKGGKNVICDDCFDTVILFSDACWVGRKDENPDEIRLDMPAELYEAKHSEYDFQGGAGATPVNNHNHDFDREVESPEPKNKLKATETTPVRQSGRTAGKTFKFAEASSSGDDSAESVSEMEEEIKEEADNIPL